MLLTSMIHCQFTLGVDHLTDFTDCVNDNRIFSRVSNDEMVVAINFNRKNINLHYKRRLS